MQLQTDKENRELKSHGCYEFPVNISYEILSQYERGAFAWHWHPEIELTFILDGEIDYQVNNRTYHLVKGDGLFCNTNALHTGHMHEGHDCHYISTTFAPRLLYGFSGSVIQTKFIEPVLTDVHLASVPLSPESEWQKTIINTMKQIYSLSLNPTITYEMEIQQLLLSIWNQLYSHVTLSDQSQYTAEARDVDRLRTLLDYIHTHYSEQITLEALAGEINICRSECCRFFKKCMNQSLFEYLMEYRISKSLPLLLDGCESITVIAEQTGFSTPAYYAKIFKKQMGCSPREYRNKGTGDMGRFCVPSPLIQKL